MSANNPYEIPDQVTNDAELIAWYEQELEKLGDEPAPEKELELLRRADRIFRTLKTETNIRFDRNSPNPYKEMLVSALMESGWEIKRGDHEHKELSCRASRIFSEALRLIPENPKACYRLGHLLKSQGKFGEAIGYFSKALELAGKQDGLQKKLQLSAAQVANASGQAMALMQRLLSPFNLDIEPTSDPEQIGTLQSLIRDTHDRLVVYSTKNGRSIETNTITSWNYDDIIRNLIKNEGAIVVDRFNKISLIRYQDNEKFFEYDTPRSGKLNYLLTALALNLEDWDVPYDKPNTIAQNIHRVNEDLLEIGVSPRLEIAYSRNDGGRVFCTRCDLTVHYFKSLLD